MDILFVHGSSNMIKYNKPTVVSVRSAKVSWVCVRPPSERRFWKITQVTMKYDPFDATSHEPWPWNYESPKESVQRHVPTHLPNHVVWSRTSKCSLNSYVTNPSTERYFDGYPIHMGPSHMIKQHKPTVVSVRSAMVSWVRVRSASKRRFGKITQVTMKHDPFDAV